jgi:hypothetical protein
MKWKVKYTLLLKKNTVYLRNVNGKEIASVEVAINEYGSFSGKFVLPMTGLTGNYSLRTDRYSGYTNFRVEEYKRPKFFVEFNAQKDQFKLNKNIAATGMAKAYSGNAIDGAKVVYTITRRTVINDYWHYWRNPNAKQNGKQIAQGETKTDAEGKFFINFLAEPDSEIDKATNPIFNFDIQASVTDINGETRESNTTIKVSYKSLFINITAPQKIDFKELNNIGVSTTNIANESIAAKVKLQISSLQTPERLIRQRLWNKADTFILSKEAYINFFPNDEYSQETDRTTWKEKEKLLIAEVKTSKDSATTNLPLNIATALANAKYIVIKATTTDEEGNVVENKTIVEITNKGVSVPQYHLGEDGKYSGKTNDTVNVAFNTSANEIFVLKQGIENSAVIGEENQKSTYSFEKITNKFNWEKQLTSKDEKGFGMFYAFVKHNRFYKGGSNIEWIRPSKKLNISYNSFRNKTLPGSIENYTVKITGPKGEKVAAELLTAMYDASLDAFTPHSFNFSTYTQDYDYSSQLGYSGIGNTNSQVNSYTYPNLGFENAFEKYNRFINPYNFPIDEGVVVNSTITSYKRKHYAGAVSKTNMSEAKKGRTSSEVVSDDAIMAAGAPGSANEITVKEEEPQKPKTENVQIRKNFNETAFFLPTIYADSNNNYSFSFTMPEALTTWKWMSFAHTKNLETVNAVKSIITAKPIMVQPNAPRFLREEDVMEFTTKIVNTTSEEITGTTTLALIDASTDNSVDGLFNNVFPLQYFTVAANKSIVIKFPIQVPANFAKPLTYRIIANVPANDKANIAAYSDGEENTLPVLTNKIYITESTPIYVKPSEEKKIVDIKEMLNTSKNKSGESITLEYTANPVWSVVKALPYLMEYPYECAEQTFNRFFANAMASSIIKSNNTIKKVIETWKADSSQIKSTLELNEEVKNILLEETPWVEEAECEAEQQKRLSLLLDLDKMQNNINTTIEKLVNKQLPNGAFSWFDGGGENEYITQYLTVGLGKLKQQNTLAAPQQKIVNEVATKALKYLDSKQTERFNNWLKFIKANKKQINCYNNPIDVHYWYMRSFYTETPLSSTLKNAYKVFIREANRNWVKQSIYNKTLLALSIYKLDNNNKLPKRIMNALYENSIEDTTKGTMYWKENSNGYYWYQNTIETQALAIQAFHEIVNDKEAVDKMKTWLLLNKQTNRWNSTISTTAACYAILHYGSNWANNQQQISIAINNKIIETDSKADGYTKFKLSEVTTNSLLENNSPTVTLTKQNTNNNSPSFGAVYYQYFANVNDVESSTSKAPLTLVKKIFIEKNDGTKKVLNIVNENDELSIGDKLIVRLELRCDRPMEFIHLKDMRAASTEPVNVLSQYKWQQGLSYYESTKDASTNFFIDYMRAGTYVFEYPLYITHSGQYSIGLAQIQCMYAPEFVSHSNGIKVKVK